MLGFFTVRVCCVAIITNVEEVKNCFQDGGGGDILKKVENHWTGIWLAYVSCIHYLETIDLRRHSSHKSTSLGYFIDLYKQNCKKIHRFQFQLYACFSLSDSNEPVCLLFGFSLGRRRFVSTCFVVI